MKSLMARKSANLVKNRCMQVGGLSQNERSVMGIYMRDKGVGVFKKYIK